MRSRAAVVKSARDFVARHTPKDVEKVIAGSPPAYAKPYSIWALEHDWATEQYWMWRGYALRYAGIASSGDPFCTTRRSGTATVVPQKRLPRR